MIHLLVNIQNQHWTGSSCSRRGWLHHRLRTAYYPLETQSLPPIFYCIIYLLMNTPYLYTVTMNTSTGWLSIHVGIYSSYDKAIEEMMKQQKEVCSWHEIDYDTASEEFFESIKSDHTWYEYTNEEEWMATWHYCNCEDDYYIEILPLPNTDQEPRSII